MKRLPIILFMAIIYLPCALWNLQKMTGVTMDVELKGFSDQYQQQEFTLEGFWTGSYQNSYTQSLDSTIPLRGVMTKTYNSINYELFNLGNRPIGKDRYIFEPSYIETELGIGKYDYSTPENIAKMQNMVNHMVSVQSKLKKYDKKLYVYIAPSKADVMPDKMPAYYVNKADSNAVNAVDLFRDMIKDTTVPYFICSDIASELQYPAFYSTGIHWSRTYEQIADSRVVSDLSKVTGKNYRNLVLGDVKTSKQDFWRDNDVFDLLNVWQYPNVDYYEYEVSIEEGMNYDSMRLLVFGDSFANGLRKDILENIPESYINIVNRNDYYWESNGNVSAIYKDWNNFDWQRNLDISDVVVIEIVEPEIVNDTFGFLEYLDAYLDSYRSKDADHYYMENIDGDALRWDTSFVKGVYSKEEHLAWATKESHMYIHNENVKDKGLEIAYTVPDQLFNQGKECSDTVQIYVNGELVSEKMYMQPCAEVIKISAKDLKINKDDNYEIEIHCSEDFNPKALGMNDDERNLAVQILYIGGAR